MALNFPASPTEGDTYSGFTYTGGKWVPVIVASSIAYDPSHIIGTPVDPTDLEHLIGHMWSAGPTHGFDLTNNGDGSVATAAGTVALRATADEHSDLVICQVAADASIALTDNSINYVYADYNAGSPVITSSTAVTDFNCLDKCVLYTIVREGTTLHIIDARYQNVDANRKHRRTLLEVDPFRHVIGGCMIGASGLSLTVTAGAYYYGLAKISHPAFDTSATDVFAAYYRNGVGGWTKQTSQTAVNSTLYDNGSGTLATLSNNKYGVHWVYLLLDTPTTLATQYGQGDYNTVADAQAAAVPTAPPAMQGVGVLIGRVIFQKSATSFYSVDSAFMQPFSPSTATAHNGLSGLQGGTTNEYYHLTSAQSTRLGDIAALAVTDGNIMVGNGTTWVAESGATARASLSVREAITANRTYYVRTDGSDSNDGLANTAGGAFLTLQKAWDTVSSLDLSTYSGTISVADGTYTAGIAVNKMPVGGSMVYLTGNTTTPANVVISVTGTPINITTPVSLTIDGVKLTTSGSGVQLIRVAHPGAVIYVGRNEYGSCSNGHHINVESGYLRYAAGSQAYTISSTTSQTHINASSNMATVIIAAQTVNLSGTPAFTVGFVNCSTAAVIQMQSNTYSGSATGKRYAVALNGVVNSFGATLPGDTAGTTATGGQYA